MQKKYKELQQRQLDQRRAAARGGRRLPAFWTVEVDPKGAGDELHPDQRRSRPAREGPSRSKPGWPFAPAKIDFRDGRIEAFSDWLTAPENPLFARVAVNRLWQWHFGEGLQKSPSDFGKLGGTPVESAVARLAGRRSSWRATSA